MLEKIIEPFEVSKFDKKERMYEPLKKDMMAMYGKIDLYKAKKEYASGKCCMCCS